MKLKQVENWLDNLGPGERDHALDHLVGLTSRQADKLSKQHEINMMIDYQDEIEERQRNWNKPVGLKTELQTLDKFTMGLAPGELTVIGGATSQGKTLLACNITSRVAAAGSNVLFVTLEMTHAELGSRIQRISGSNADDISVHVAFQKSDELDWQSIDGLIANAVKQFGAELVVIDHLHYFTRELQNVSEDLGRITKEFKKNAIRHGIPIMLISHTRKGDSKQLSTIDDLRGSSYIAQDADIVLMVGQKQDTQDVLFVTVEKNRNRFGVRIGSPEATCMLTMDHNTLRLEDPLDGPFPGGISAQQIFPDFVPNLI